MPWHKVFIRYRMCSPWRTLIAILEPVYIASQKMTVCDHILHVWFIHKCDNYPNIDHFWPLMDRTIITFGFFLRSISRLSLIYMCCMCWVSSYPKLLPSSFFEIKMYVNRIEYFSFHLTKYCTNIGLEMFEFKVNNRNPCNVSHYNKCCNQHWCCQTSCRYNKLNK